MKRLGITWTGASGDTFFNDSRAVGLLLEKCGFQGMMLWAQWVMRRTPDFNEPVNPYHDVPDFFKGGPWAAVDPQGRISRSLNWMGVRECIDDVRYVRTARSLGQRALASTGPKLRKQGRNALKRLDLAVGRVPYADEVDRDRPWNDAVATSVRRQVAAIAVKLHTMLATE